MSTKEYVIHDGHFPCIPSSSWLGVLPGVQFEGDLGKILTLGAEILPYIGLREKWDSP